MRTRKAIAASTVLALGALAAAAAQEQPSREEVFQQFQKLVPPDAVTQLQIFHANGFRIESSNNKELGGNFKPNGNEFQSAIVTADGGFTTVVEKGRPTSVGGALAMFHRQSGLPILSVADADGDGRLDGLTYTSVDADGKATLSVTDYEADGQLDLRINFVDRYTELWHGDRWYRMEMRDGRRGIVKDGAFVELQRRDNRYYVP